MLPQDDNIDASNAAASAAASASRATDAVSEVEGLLKGAKTLLEELKKNADALQPPKEEKKAAPVNPNAVPVKQEKDGPVNPNATRGAGRGAPVKLPKMSLPKVPPINPKPFDIVFKAREHAFGESGYVMYLQFENPDNSLEVDGSFYHRYIEGKLVEVSAYYDTGSDPPAFITDGDWGDEIDTIINTAGATGPSVETQQNTTQVQAETTFVNILGTGDKACSDVLEFVARDAGTDLGMKGGGTPDKGKVVTYSGTKWTVDYVKLVDI